MNDKLEIEKLYKLKADIDSAVEENFGQCPNYDWFHRLEMQWRDQELLVKINSPEEYEKYEKSVYN